MQVRSFLYVQLAALAFTTLVPTGAHAGEAWTCGLFDRAYEATIVGTPGDDVLRGTDGTDVIVARGGDDIISGFNETDIICAGRGDDTVWGGSYDDYIRGGRGNDRLYGQDDGFNGDQLNGGPGNDFLNGGKTRNANGSYFSAADTVDYSTSAHGVDVNLDIGVARGEGRDTFTNIGSVVGSPFNDRVYAGTGAPAVYVVATWEGDDILTLDRGASYLTGGNGDDTYNFLEGAYADEVRDHSGHDTYNRCAPVPFQDFDDDYVVNDTC